MKTGNANIVQEDFHDPSRTKRTRYCSHLGCTSAKTVYGCSHRLQAQRGFLGTSGKCRGALREYRRGNPVCRESIERYREVLEMITCSKIKLLKYLDDLLEQSDDSGIIRNICVTPRCVVQNLKQRLEYGDFDCCTGDVE